MTLYEINKQIDELLENGFTNECVDPETGEIDENMAMDMLRNLEMDQSTKLENIGCMIKNLDSDIKALKEEEEKLKKRRDAAENKKESLKRFLTISLEESGFTKFETPRCALSFRKSDSVEIESDLLIPEEYLNIKTTVTPNKTAIKDALKNGIEIPGVSIVTKNNLQVK